MSSMVTLDLKKFISELSVAVTVASNLYIQETLKPTSSPIVSLVLCSSIF